MTLVNRGNANANARRYDRADEDYVEALGVLACTQGTIDSRTLGICALVREMRGLLLNDRREWTLAIREHDEAVALLRELVRQGRLDLRTTLAHACSNRAETHIAMGLSGQAADDLLDAKRIYDECKWEDSSRLALWVAVNQTTLQGLNRILGTSITVAAGHESVPQTWVEVVSQRGKHVLAPFVRATTGIARLVWAVDPQFSADTVRGTTEAIEGVIRGGYWPRWAHPWPPSRT
jgi:tetratricopeptide (TPR) repeat protein